MISAEKTQARAAVPAAETRDDTDIEIVDWDGPDDPASPYNWPKAKKCIITAVALFATFTTMMNGTILTVAHEAINTEFHVSDAHFPHSYWPVTSWALGGSLFSFVVLPLMEDFGFRPAFLGTYLAFIVFLVPTAVARNFATLVATRFVGGGCVAILANSTSSVIGNVWAGDRARTLPMSLWIALYLAGSSGGPVVGAAIHAHLPSWRWIAYCELAWYGAAFPLYLLLLPESRGAVVLAGRAAALREGRGRPNAFTAAELEVRGTRLSVAARVLDSARRPLCMLLTEPVCMVCTLMAGLIIGNTYLFTQSAEQVFAALYGFDPVAAGYAQAAVVAGEAVGWLLSLLSARLYFASAARNVEVPGTPIPEARLYVAIPAGFVGMAGGMFVYGWTSWASVPWIAPAVGLAMVGAGNTVVIIGFADYVVDAYAKYAGSSMGAVALGENIFAAFLPLAAQPMYTNLGFQWASSLLGFVSLLLACAPVVLVIWGRKIRESSPFMKEAMLEKRMQSKVEGEP
ncbi:MFS transporter [Neofusicoccum parvum]|uniref:MFS transporter n=1 Tax=Neofusicoccum parvum TaxID=310453 RepID=A0ACB5RQP8_9PEZI|nr:MFS transporter [Neofusicoccum parvum]